MKALPVKIYGFFPSYIPVPNGKGSWVSTDTLTIQSDRVGTFVIPAGALNDLASIPKPVRSLITVNGPHRIAAIAHDWLYEVKGHTLQIANITRQDADALFFDMMQMSKNDFYNSLSAKNKLYLISLGLESDFLTHDPLVGKVTAHTMYAAVRLAGGFYWG